MLGSVASLPTALAQESVSPTTQYLALRRASPIVWGLTLEKIRETPSTFKGKAFELEGTIAGLSPSNDGSGLMIFKTLASGTLTLRMSQLPAWLQPGAIVRVLCIVTEGGDDSGLIIGLPELEVIAVASALDINSLEARWKAEQEYKTALRKQQEQERLKDQERLRVTAATAPRGNLSSRALPIKSLAGKKQIVLGPPRFEDLSASARAVFPAYRGYIKNHNKRLSDTQADKITYAILRYSEEMDMDPRLIVATVIAESDFKIQDRSHAGAMGLIQLMPDEVERLKLTNPFDEIQNLAGGIFLLKERLNKYSKSSTYTDATLEQLILTLASYNAGEGAVKKYGGVPPYRETQGYVKKIMRIYKELIGQ
ncbi:lytic transglycosylase domain-containing protein [Armatimonas sp.]|uniref:lytic transglycosylase domain-containing protein n=1 Tax=Armatimonas sp. TaxID=1872638 RepID=UPI003751AB80